MENEIRFHIGLRGGECQNNPDAYDVQNIPTHEFGDWVGLDDLYANAAKV